MFILWLILGAASFALCTIAARKVSQAAASSTIGNGTGLLLSGIWDLEMTSEMVLSMDRDWRELWMDAADGAFYCGIRFIGWACIVAGIGMLASALIQTIESQKSQSKPQWPTGNSNQVQTTVQPVAQPAVQPAAQKPTTAATAPVEHETIFCSKCGRKQRKSNSVCWDCGAEL